MKDYLTWAEFYDFALKNYANGGDVIVECWDENEFNEYVETFGPITYEIAKSIFNLNNVIWNEMQATIW